MNRRQSGDRVSDAREPALAPSVVWRLEPLVALAGAWAFGLLVGSIRPTPWLWCVIAVVGTTATAWLWRRGTSAERALPMVLLTVAAAGAGWWTLRTAIEPVNIAGELSHESRLIDVTGRIVDAPRIRTEPGEGLAAFMFRPPVTSFLLDLERWHGPDGKAAVRGKLLVSIPAVDTRPRRGDRVRLQGWAARFHDPQNPGEFDYAELMAGRSVMGAVRLKSRGNLRWLSFGEAGGWAARIAAGHERLIEIVDAALCDGLTPEANREPVALLEALILGQRSEALEELYEAFRRTGLAHLLSISGLHVGILAAGLWALVSTVSGRPRWAAIAALIGVIAYVAVVPWRVPIIRAGFMTGCCALGLSWSQRPRGSTLMAVIGLAWLVVRPTDLFAPGFQLSFGIVAALLLFARPVARRIAPEPAVAADQHPPRPLRRWLADYLAVSLVAWLAAAPVVAYHFQLISPLAVLLGIAAFPMVVLMLWLGFVKIVLTLIAPPLGDLLAEPLLWIGRLCIAAVRGADDLPGAWLELPPPSAAWALVTTTLVAATLGGAFRGRHLACLAALALSVGWLYLPPVSAALTSGPPPALTLHALAVGDGSCFLLRSGSRTLLFDCGSSNYAEIGRYTIIPALRELGVRRIDTLVISHADYDHYSGTLDVAEHLPVGRVLTTQAVLDEARAEPDRGTAYLIAHLRQLGVPIAPIAAGWREEFGRATVEAIWPPANRKFERNNDRSLVFAFDAAGRRLLMCGDIQEEAMAAMRRAGLPLDADVADLPHHGSFPPGAVEWLDAVDPQVVVQSSSERRLRWDKWAGRLDDVERLITAHHGMVSVRLEADGSIRTARFQNDADDLASRRPRERSADAAAGGPTD